MESFDDDVYSMRARTQCVPLKLLVKCTFFLSSLIATHSCKCFLRVFAISREASIQTYWCPSKDIPLHATVSFQKAKKNLIFFLDAINFSQSFTVTQISVSFLPTSQQRVGKHKNNFFFERIKFLFSQGDRNLLKISPQTRRLEMFRVLMQCLSLCHVKGMHLI